MVAEEHPPRIQLDIQRFEEPETSKIPYHSVVAMRTLSKAANITQLASIH